MKGICARARFSEFIHDFAQKLNETRVVILIEARMRVVEVQGDEDPAVGESFCEAFNLFG